MNTLKRWVIGFLIFTLPGIGVAYAATDTNTVQNFFLGDVELKDTDLNQVLTLLKGEPGKDGVIGRDGIDGINGIDGIDGINGIDGAGVKVVGLALSDPNCPTGGMQLDSYPTPEQFFICNGEDGVDGADGSGVTVLPLAKGNLNCVNGGLEIKTYPIVQTSYLCNGVDGRDGRDGRDGVDGKDGVAGKDGVDGKDGKDGLNGTSETNTVTIGGKIVTNVCDNSVKIKLNHAFTPNSGFAMSSIVVSELSQTCLSASTTFALTTYLQIKELSGSCDLSAALDSNCLQGVAGRAGQYVFGGVVSCTIDLVAGVNVTSPNSDGDVTATIGSTAPCIATSPEDDWATEVNIATLSQLSPMDIDGTLGFAIEETDE